ncbi:4-hydroxybenzoyl-CoA thioesterase [Golovinomyces cichoracearum]|uniref:4-hydroxybenzoyl-CoA thioesterase n=1 Tax=Golovinomyces cichoracearum TaxID=62708 RepID=A0A420ITI8_9PEZI|nr:4-hydroxybenzoyl-CoA thioesterase [Golovinomyces cichoracearum]
MAVAYSIIVRLIFSPNSYFHNAKIQHLPLKVIVFLMSWIAVFGTSHPKIPQFITSIFSGPGSYSRILVVVLLIVNLKNFPLIWHLRVWSAILKHCLFDKPKVPQEIAPSTLFLPVITTSRSPLMECDYNFHKSNSTYFSDLDVARSHIICALLEPGIYRIRHNVEERLVLMSDGSPASGRWSFNLGATACNFKKEIGIYEPYEMWSRLLCWDKKWLYFVTHFVKMGTVKPSAYVLTDGSWFGKGYRTVKGQGQENQDVDEKAIFASAISKCVVKLGRLTVHPEVLLDAANVLPPRPGGWHSMNGSYPSSSTHSKTTHDLSWEKVIEENERGLKYAHHFAALDGLIDQFSGSQRPALGKFADLIM